MNKTYHNEKFLKIVGHLSLLEKDYKDFKILSNKQSFEEVLIQWAVKTFIQILFDKRLFDGFPKTNEVLKDFLFVTRRRGDLEESKWCRSLILFLNVNWKTKQNQL